MKTWTIALAASLLVVAVPFVTAEEPCTRAAATEALSHPREEGRYFFFDATEPEKLGEWTERNHKPGLQTVACWSGSGKYNKDLHVSVLG